MKNLLMILILLAITITGFVISNRRNSEGAYLISGITMCLLMNYTMTKKS